MRCAAAVISFVYSDLTRNQHSFRRFARLQIHNVFRTKRAFREFSNIFLIVQEPRRRVLKIE